ncbi:CRISPR-associated helicase Cas3' [Pyrobaculum arsenaticum]|uniref:CRISPR-associated helicase, Cas3 family n=2 Tax=Pyrobaculum arsenaticum TaxID=121277 RepID=A4WJZ1_PYRAR|nr:CRISPR-associated helicase Cas3' [Pyrobaculum arsenaticum]ABP50708.1 CRISPR-associated helicase, Cas3 family [Pyrobaculum arsenaticum DSM 13514]NYR15569.1 CRISPR-associated helicase Cas3' [Pyrobaculum arsenaticum]
MRRAIRKALELAERGVDKIVSELPTGYGKTVAAPLLYKRFRAAGLCWKAIHVFPLRAVLHTTLKRYVTEHPDIQFAYQDGDVTLRADGYVKDPWFTSEYVLTTYDSFIHNLLKAPVAEFHKLLSHGRGVHYHWPMAEVYPSCVFLDEVHLAVEGAKQVAAVSVVVNMLREMEVPTVVLSATMGRWKHDIFKDFVFVQLGEKDEEGDRLVVVRDEEFEKSMGEVEYSVDVIDENSVAALARRKVKEGRRVLVVLNSLKKVVALKNELGDLNPVLIHSMLTRRDRQAAEEEVKKAQLVIGTSAIEAGVDTSFDVLISDTPSAESVVQRVGRVCRYGGRCKGELYFFGEGAEELREVKHWRLPYKKGSYAGLLREQIEKDRRLTWLYEMLARALWIEDINELFKKLGASFFREGLLVEAVAGSGFEMAFSASLGKLVELGYTETVDGEQVKGDVYIFLLDYVKRRGELPAIRIPDYVEGVGPAALYE